MKWIGLWLALLTSAAAAQPLPGAGESRIERLPALQPRHVDTHPVDVWLPAEYSPAKRYRVLYMHDGQMLFDAGKSWNQQAWNVLVTVNFLVQQGRLPDTPVVGAWNNRALRRSEHYRAPLTAFRQGACAPAVRGSGIARQGAIGWLLALPGRRTPTRHRRPLRHPARALTHVHHEFDALYAPHQAFIHQTVKDWGYPAANSLSLVFEGAGHSEGGWAARLEIPLLFLLLLLLELR